MKLFISTFGTSLPTEPWRRLRRIRNDAGQVCEEYMEVSQSNIVKSYYQSANCIDVHNQLWQHLLGLEEIWQTKDWWIRLFQTLLGMAVVNSFRAFVYFEESNIALKEFVNTLSISLCRPAVSPPRQILRCLNESAKKLVEPSVPDHCPVLIRGSGYGTASVMGKCKVLVDDSDGVCGKKAY